jgi:hypothetical protein
MAEPMATQPEGPFEGWRCVAAPGNRWAAATVRRVNEDGTFTVEFDHKEMIVMKFWYGLTAPEISFNDSALWAVVLAALTSGRSELSRSDFAAALARLGANASDEQITQFWGETCKKLFAMTGLPAALSASQAYQLFLSLGVSAKRLQTELATMSAVEPRYLKVYWNQTRMGGRSPSDVPRPVTLQDAFESLGLSQITDDGDRVRFLADFEIANGISLPANLKTFMSRRSIERAVADCHPNNPNLVPLTVREWKLRRAGKGVEASHAVTIMTPHQGDFVWVAAFNAGEPDARIYVAEYEEDDEEAVGKESLPWALTAQTVGMFFWDLAQTGLAWYQHTKFKGGRPARRTDIGLAPLSD